MEKRCEIQKGAQNGQEKMKIECERGRGRRGEGGGKREEKEGIGRSKKIYMQK